MKTNHQRGFVEKVTRYVGPSRDGSRTRPNSEYGITCGSSDGFRYFSSKSKIGDTIITAGASANIHDTTNGKHGVAKNIRGAKKYVRTRIRFREKAATRKLVDGVDDAPS